LMSSNSNFRNPTFEEPSPAKNEDYGMYHNNIVDQSVENQPPLLPRAGKIAGSSSNPVFKVAGVPQSTYQANTTNMSYDSGHAPAMRNYQFAMNDKISMFSSQDPQQRTLQMNSSDIVEYNRDGSVRRACNVNNADTLERDVSPYS